MLDTSPKSDYNISYTISPKSDLKKKENKFMNYTIQKELKEYNKIYKELNDIYHDIALKTGLSDSAFDIFYTIAIMGNGCLQRDICQMTFLSKQTIHSSVRKLEGEGYIYLKKGAGRSMHIFLTSAGETLVAEKIQPVIAIEQKSFEDITQKETAELLRLNKKYASKLRENIKLL